MISGMHDLRVAKEAIDLGAIDYLPKPVDYTILHNLIKEHENSILGSGDTGSPKVFSESE